MKKSSMILASLFVLALNACGDDTATTSSSSSSSSSSSLSSGLLLVAAADFDSSASSSLSGKSKYLTASDCGGETPPTDMDSPDFAAGVDCDEDDGIVSFATPTQYKVAVRHIGLIKSDGTHFDIIPQVATLAQSELIEFSTTDVSENVVEFDPSDLEAGTYTGLYVELYYYQMTFPVAGESRNVRIYMSDDDFESEGNLGHHQGDITFINDSNAELGWASSDWLLDSILPTRVGQEGAGGTDPQTGHVRGFFGNEDLWNAMDFMQGSDEDIYFAVLDFPSALTIADPAELESLITIEISFLVGDAFYYEDFAPQGTGFFPDTGGEATSEDDEWGPLTPTIRVTVTTE